MRKTVGEAGGEPLATDLLVTSLSGVLELPTAFLTVTEPVCEAEKNGKAQEEIY